MDEEKIEEVQEDVIDLAPLFETMSKLYEKVESLEIGINELRARPVGRVQRVVIPEVQKQPEPTVQVDKDENYVPLSKMDFGIKKN